ncbi:MAG: alkaline phosphatase D family protein, partial [Woeseiaceae bacterium]
MRRRNFLRALAGGSILSWLGLKPNDTHAATLTFEHGIASGDPLSDRVILWTRVSGYVEESVDVRWRIAGDPDMRSVLNRGEVRTGPEQDYTVKVDATRLPENSTLYYQFEIDGTTSPTGRTKTLPTGTLDTARFAVVSCANYPYGYFHVYREIAKCDDIDAVIHLGDYIYEYGMGEYATERAEELQRVPEPRHEAYTLADLRKRHAQYKTDADSQAMHAAHPLIAIWDDHELGNDAWRNGSNNHQPEEGQWPERRDAAIRAYLEWMPIRARHERGQTRLFRDFRYGDLLTLIMLDTRLYGRDVQADANPEATRGDIESAMGDPERRLLGRH